MQFIYLFNKFSRLIRNLDPTFRRSLLVLSDLVFVNISILTSQFLINPTFSFNELKIHLQNSCLLTIFFILAYIFANQYNKLIRYRNSDLFFEITKNNIILILIYKSLSTFSFLHTYTFKELIVIGLLITFSINLYRFFLIELIYTNRIKDYKKIKNIAIYGAGSGGAYLAYMLNQKGNFKVKYFIDNDPKLWGRTINNIKIYSPKCLDKFACNIDQVLIAIPSLSKKNKQEILEKIKNLNLPVYETPSIEDIASGKAKIDSLKPIEIENLLGRDPFKGLPEFLESGIKDKTIFISGAAGSIGSELIRQIINLKPKYLIAFERNEENLYNLIEELKEKKIGGNIFKPILGDALDLNLLRKIFEKYQIEIIFHAAAYKHVPIVEQNPIQGLLNNVLSTRNICSIAKNSNVKKVILISSDKAVRPKNIMGASKVVSELIIRKLALEDKKTIYSLVRFGNVLNSSGSVVPLFKRQIKNGGPITLTHPEVVRYFMTINEAAELVLHSSLMAKSGEIFILDMGSPMKIKELAEKMIKISGLEIKDENNPNGDIEICTTGLREGEKLFEELLVDGKALKTFHPRIFRSSEKTNIDTRLWEEIDSLEYYLKNYDLINTTHQLKKIVKEWDNKSF